MANQVTISTFLDLKDNLSPGLAKVEAAMKRMTQQAALMNGAMVRSAANVKSTDAGFKSVGAHLSKAVQQANNLAAAVKKIKVPAMPGAGATPSIAPSGGGGADAQKGLLGTLVKANLLTDALEMGIGKATQAITFMFKSAIHYGMEYEKVNTGIASALFTTNLSASMETAKGYAKSLMKTMHDLSLILPGSAQDFYQVFEQALPGAIGAGITDMQKYSKFISEYTAVAIKRNVGSAKAATDIQMMMQGTVRVTTRMFRMLQNYIGMTSKEFNELMKTDRAKGMALLMRAVEKSASGMYGAASDAITVFGELQTRLQDIAIIGEKPIFDAAKNTAVDLNTWLKASHDEVNNLALAVSTVLGDALRGVALTVTDILSGFMSILGIAKTAKSKEARTPADIKKELEDVKKAGAYPGAFKLLGFSPIMETVYRGKIARLAGELSQAEKTEVEMAQVRKEFSALTTFAPIDLSKDSVSIARQSTERYKAGWFEGHGRSEQEAFDVYLKSQGVKDLNKRQEIWTEMLKMGAERPLTLSDTETPAGRASNYQDFRYSRFDINQAFAEGFDPDRIAVAFTNDLARVAEMKTQAMGSPTFSASP